MDHRQIIAALSPADRAFLTETADAPGLRHLAGHLGAIVLIGALIHAGVPGWPVLLLPQGILIVFLFTLLHETLHETPFATRSLNRAVGLFCGFALILPPGWFRYFHLAHHRHTQIPGKDPELDSPKPETRTAYLWHISGMPVWIAQVRTLFSNALGLCRDRYVPKTRRDRIAREARVMQAGYGALLAVSLVMHSTALIWVWLLPLILGQPVLRVYLLAEHGRCAHVADMLANSRTTFTNRLVRWLAWNMPYHAEHHSLPTVPFHKLPALHARIAPHLKETGDGYSRVTAGMFAALD